MKRRLKPPAVDPTEQLLSRLEPAELAVLDRTLQTLTGGGDARLLARRREFKSLAAKVARKR